MHTRSLCITTCRAFMRIYRPAAQILISLNAGHYSLAPLISHVMTLQAGRTRYRLSGKPVVTKDDVAIDARYFWLSNWVPDCIDGRVEGYIYASSFSTPFGDWQSVMTPLPGIHCVRRRCWYRLRHPVEPGCSKAETKLLDDQVASAIGRTLLDMGDAQQKKLLKLFNSQAENGGVLGREAVRKLAAKLGKPLTDGELGFAIVEMKNTAGGVQDGDTLVDFEQFSDWWQNVGSRRGFLGVGTPESKQPPPPGVEEPSHKCQPCGASTSASAAWPMAETRTARRDLMRANCELVTPMQQISGTLYITDECNGSQIYFCPQDIELTSQYYRWNISDITRLFRRRCVMQWTAIEMFFSDRTSCLLNFPPNDKWGNETNKVIFDLLVAERWRDTPPQPSQAVFGATADLLAELTAAWGCHAISNFEYLMELNGNHWPSPPAPRLLPSQCTIRLLCRSALIVTAPAVTQLSGLLCQLWPRGTSLSRVVTLLL